MRGSPSTTIPSPLLKSGGHGDRGGMTDISGRKQHPFHQSVLPTNPALTVTPATLSPEIIVAGVAHLLGFHPEESLIIVALAADAGRPVVATLRVDLPAIDDVEERSCLVAWLEGPLAAAADRCDSMMVIVWSQDRALENEELIDDVADLLDSMDIVVADGLVVRQADSTNEGRAITWRSVWCSGESCCGMDGNRLSRAHLKAASRLFAGARPEPADSRADLESELIRIDPCEQWPGGAGPITSVTRDAFEIAVVHAVSYLSSGVVESEHDRALLASALWDMRVRDTVIWEMLTHSPADWSRAADALTGMVRSCPEPFVAALATCLGILRWQLGDGVRAMIALEHALTADPQYTLAGLVAGCISTGVHPADWREDLHRLERSKLTGC